MAAVCGDGEAQGLSILITVRVPQVGMQGDAPSEATTGITTSFGGRQLCQHIVVRGVVGLGVAVVIHNVDAVKTGLVGQALLAFQTPYLQAGEGGEKTKFTSDNSHTCDRAFMLAHTGCNATEHISTSTWEYDLLPFKMSVS